MAKSVSILLLVAVLAAAVSLRTAHGAITAAQLSELISVMKSENTQKWLKEGKEMIDAIGDTAEKAIAVFKDKETHALGTSIKVGEETLGEGHVVGFFIRGTTILVPFLDREAYELIKDHFQGSEFSAGTGRVEQLCAGAALAATLQPVTLLLDVNGEAPVKLRRTWYKNPSNEHTCLGILTMSTA